MKNKGLHAYRFKENPEEKRFAKAWENENDRVIGTHLIEHLLGDGAKSVEASDRDREVAATVIQWLGSPVGQNWLRDLGYEKKKARK